MGGVESRDRGGADVFVVDMGCAVEPTTAIGRVLDVVLG